MNGKIDYLREGVRRLIEAASNPALSDSQADTLMNEAKDNSVIAFGADSDHEFSELVRQHIRAMLQDQTVAGEHYHS